MAQLKWLILDEADRSVSSDMFPFASPWWLLTLLLLILLLLILLLLILLLLIIDLITIDYWSYYYWLLILLLLIIDLITIDYWSRLLELGFEQDLSFIMSTIKDHSSSKVQNVLMSATLSQGMTTRCLIFVIA